MRDRVTVSTQVAHPGHRHSAVPRTTVTVPLSACCVLYPVVGMDGTNRHASLAHSCNPSANTHSTQCELLRCDVTDRKPRGSQVRVDAWTGTASPCRFRCIEMDSTVHKHCIHSCWFIWIVLLMVAWAKIAKGSLSFACWFAGCWPRQRREKEKRSDRTAAADTHTASCNHTNTQQQHSAHTTHTARAHTLQPSLLPP